MKYVVCTNHDLRMACIDNNWFKSGDNTQYEKMFDMNSNAMTFRLRDIATAIYICSDTSYASVLEVLLKLQCKYMYNMLGEQVNY